MDEFDLNLIQKYVPKCNQKKAINKLKKGYPVQYIIGNVDFNGIIIDVNKHVLIPRFETELLVDKTIKLLKKYNFNKPNILEIGTGSGCISIYMKKNYACTITAIDKSYKALKLAKKNAQKNKTNIKFIWKDIIKYTPANKFDVLISNPPYVGFGENVDSKTKYEPKMAIFAKDDGLYFYKQILEKSKLYLNKSNIICFECGKSQGDKIKSIAQDYYPNSLIIVDQDLNNLDRYVFIINE